VFGGRLMPWKGVRLGLEALARPEAANWRLDVYGGGNDRARLEAAVGRLGLGERVRFLGSRPRVEVLAAMADADALLMPSLHDGGSFVIAEAMAVGCPVVCLDWGGPRTLLRDGGGVLVPVRGDVPGAMARALSTLGPRGRLDRRWSVDRLADVVDGWYRAATSALPADVPR
jgi:glycosyltransferase involved in cell wall biosynthesis